MPFDSNGEIAGMLKQGFGVAEDDMVYVLVLEVFVFFYHEDTKTQRHKDVSGRVLYSIIYNPRRIYCTDSA